MIIGNRFNIMLTVDSEFEVLHTMPLRETWSVNNKGLTMSVLFDGCDSLEGCDCVGVGSRYFTFSLPHLCSAETAQHRP